MSEKIFEELLGKTLVVCERGDHNGDEAIKFVTTEGDTYYLCHHQDCCESVTIEDIAGELNDLVGSPLHMAEVVYNSDMPPKTDGDYTPESYTWPFFKFATVKGYVTIRFYGTSNGYYSETADLYED